MSCSSFECQDVLRPCVSVAPEQINPELCSSMARRHVTLLVGMVKVEFMPLASPLALAERSFARTFTRIGPGVEVYPAVSLDLGGQRSDLDPSEHCLSFSQEQDADSFASIRRRRPENKKLFAERSAKSELAAGCEEPPCDAPDGSRGGLADIVTRACTDQEADHSHVGRGASRQPPRQAHARALAEHGGGAACQWTQMLCKVLAQTCREGRWRKWWKDYVFSQIEKLQSQNSFFFGTSKSLA